MRKIHKIGTKLLVSFLFVILVILLVLLSLKKKEFDVAHDFYRQYYWPKISTLEETEQAKLIGEEITISVVNLKMMDKDYERKLRHRREGTLIIRVKQPLESQKIDFQYIN
ncbi:MAG TPA: hypothetical protein VIG45_07540 [Erysipelothrix sp.]